MKTTKKKVIIIILAVIALIGFMFIFDYGRVVCGERPVFSLRLSENMYYGLGWVFEICPHPITGKNEYVFYIFGIMAENNVTN